MFYLLKILFFVRFSVSTTNDIFSGKTNGFRVRSVANVVSSDEPAESVPKRIV